MDTMPAIKDSFTTWRGSEIVRGLSIGPAETLGVPVNRLTTVIRL